MTIEDNAMQILNALAPLSRKDEWWTTDGPFAVVEAELRRLYPQPAPARFETFASGRLFWFVQQ